jgi:hypothetical protein
MVHSGNLHGGCVTFDACRGIIEGVDDVSVAMVKNDIIVSNMVSSIVDNETVSLRAMIKRARNCPRRSKTGDLEEIVEQCIDSLTREPGSKAALDTLSFLVKSKNLYKFICVYVTRTWLVRCEASSPDNKLLEHFRSAKDEKGPIGVRRTRRLTHLFKKEVDSC